MTQGHAPRQIVLDTVDSTIDEARRRLDAAGAEGLWIFARAQASGRGRQGRTWHSPFGNLYATRLVRLGPDPGAAARHSFTVALAVADTISHLAPGPPVTLKWPNDVLLNNRKVSGILLENFGADASGGLRIAIGIGINLAHHPDPATANWPPTSILAETGTAPPFEQASRALARHLDARLTKPDDFAPIRREWLSRAAHLHQRIEVRLPNTTLRGCFSDLDEQGALVLEGADGPRRIAAGDVYFPGDA